MLLLILSILILGTGPILYKFVSRYTQAQSLLDGFVFFSIGGLLLVHVLPETIAMGGAWAILAGLLGLFLPLVFERAKSLGHKSVHAIVFGGAVTFLILHALFDGIAIGSGLHKEGRLALSLAVILHRLPVALVIWWLIRPDYGKRLASAALCSVAIATLTGFLLEGQIHHLFNGPGFAYLQAFVAGSLLHVIAHQGHDHDHDHDHSDGHHDHNHTPSKEHPRWESLGAGLGIALVALLPVLESWYKTRPNADHHDHFHGHGHDHVVEMAHNHDAATTSLFNLTGYGDRLLDLFLESAPALLLGYILAGVFVAFLPLASLKWMGKGGNFSQAVRGTLFGLPIPICSCGVVPLYRSLIERGVPTGAALAFLVATPELGIEALIISIPLLGFELTVTRLIAAFVVALVVGWGLGALFNRMKQPYKDFSQELSQDLFKQRPASLKQKFQEAGRFGLVEVVDDTAAWIVTGLAIAALFAPGTLPHFFEALPLHSDVLFFAILGLPLYVCASGATPLAAAIIFAGASPGAAVAFLLAGPASNVTTLGVLSKMHGKSQAWVFGATVVGLAVLLGLGINMVLGTSYTVPLANAAHQDHAGWLQITCAVILSLIFLASILRHGPRSWFHTVLSLGAHHTHTDMEHGACCGHDHSHESDQGKPSLALHPSGVKGPVVKLSLGASQKKNEEDGNL